MRILPYFFLFLLTFSCTPTAQKNEIKSISASTFGGMLGYGRVVKITKDSIFNETSMAADSTKNSSSKKLNTQYKLQNLITEDQLNELSQVKNGRSNQPVDGTDTKLTIETDKEIFKITNAEDNATWKKIVDKMYSLENLDLK